MRCEKRRRGRKFLPAAFAFSGFARDGALERTDGLPMQGNGVSAHLYEKLAISYNYNDYT